MPKPIVRNWHREAFALGNKEGIPAQALAILEAELHAKKHAVMQAPTKPLSLVKKRDKAFNTDE